MTIEQLLEDILRREGGFVHHPADKGKATKYGITQRTLSKHLGHEVSVEEVKALDKELAKEIYKADYYYGPRIHTLPEELQAQVFDIAVNSGPRKAVSMLQEVLNMAGFECSVDGMIGPGTRKQAEAAQQAMGPLLNNALCEFREHFYRSIVASNPSQGVFLEGWLNRAKEFRI
jgi:lysozyme family protein